MTIQDDLDQQLREEQAGWPSPQVERAVAVTRQRIAFFLHSCSDSWGRAADQYESYGDKEQAKAC